MSQNYVFIIGAGASKEIGLPTGIELKRKIADLLNIEFDFAQPFPKSGDFMIWEAIKKDIKETKKEKFDPSEWHRYVWHIRDALPLAISIDNFIDTHRNNDKIRFISKLAIVRAILAAEQRSSLYKDYRHDQEINWQIFDKTWFNPFFRLVTENCEKKDLPERFEKISLVIFNYDRCVEEYLFTALKKYYQIEDSEVAEIIKHMKIIHPYGYVGPLKWENKPHWVSFGFEPNLDSLLVQSQLIQTFTEKPVSQVDEITALHSLIAGADKVCFIGFAFHGINMTLLRMEEMKKTPTKCFATAYNISESDKESIVDELKSLLGAQLDIHMTNKTCAEFFTEYWKSLSFSNNVNNTI